MKAFTGLLIFSLVLIAMCVVQTSRLDSAKAEIARITADLDATKAAQRADRETFAAQIKLIREASNNADKAHKKLSDKAGLSDADWLESVLGSMWNKNTDGGAVPAGMDVGAVQGAGSNAGTVTGKDASAVQRGHDPQGN